jgi:uncharacterized damage-inducible protein DinB
MAETNKLEVWLRGPLEDVLPTLQPVAHALLQAREELNELLQGFPNEKLWDKPAGVASVAFHLQHLQGVLNRLFTYAKGSALSEEQLMALKSEGQNNPALTAAGLVDAFNEQVDRAMIQLKETGAEELPRFRGVGRQQLPSTVLGLYVHAAEHTMRHLGQLLVTVKIILHSNPSAPTAT